MSDFEDESREYGEPTELSGSGEDRPTEESLETLLSESPLASRTTSTPFEDLGVLGQGGMGRVLEAFDPGLRRTVALKTLRAELVSNPEHRRRFFQEANILANLPHPGAIPLYEAGALPDGRLFYSMQKIDGLTLAQLLDGRSPDEVTSRPAVARLLRIFDKVCQTVAFAHQRGVVHRDLKPDNIMVGDYGQVFVIDWGTAKSLHADLDETPGENVTETLAGWVIGTPGYMSPEQAEGRSHESDRRADVFSLGVILYQILTGRQPFQAETGEATLSQIRSLDPVPPRSSDRRVDRTLSAICMKCLRKDRSRRYPHAGGLAEDLRCHFEYRQGSAIAPRWRDRAAHWIHHHPAWAAVAATLLIGLLATAILFSLHRVTENRLIDEGMQQITTWKQERTHLSNELSTLRSLVDSGNVADSSSKLPSSIAELEARDSILVEQIGGTAHTIVGRNLSTPDARAVAVLRDLTEEHIDALISSGDWAGARAHLGALRHSGVSSSFDLELEGESWIEGQLQRIDRESSP